MRRSIYTQNWSKMAAAAAGKCMRTLCMYVCILDELKLYKHFAVHFNLPNVYLDKPLSK